MRLRRIKVLWQDQSTREDGEIEPSERKFRTLVLVIAALVGPPLLFLLYYTVMFKQLASVDAFDFAQLGRNISGGKGFVTSVIRPLGLDGTGPNPLRQPELVQGPLYPFVLALAFGIAGAKDAVVAWVSGLFYLLTIPVIYRLATKVFDRSVALVTVMVFTVNALMLNYAYSGLPLTMEIFLSTWLMLVMYNLAAFARDHETESVVKLPRGQLISAGIILGLLYLTDTIFLWVVPAAMAWVFWLFGFAGKKRWKAVFTFAGWFGIFSVPLMLRYAKLGVNPFFGLRISEIWMNTRFYEGYDAYRYMPGELASTPALFKEVVRKVFFGVGKAIQGLPEISASWILAFFLPSLLFRFTDPAANRLRQAMVVFFLSLLVGMLFFGIHRLSTVVTMMPTVLAFAVAYLLYLIRQAQMSRTSMTITAALLSLVVILPLANKLLGEEDKRLKLDYRHEATAARGLAKLSPNKTDVVISDIPQVVAWYGKRSSIFIPKTDEDLNRLRQRFKNANWLFLTETTPTFGEEWRAVYNFAARFNEQYTRAASTPEGVAKLRDFKFLGPIPANWTQTFGRFEGYAFMPPIKGGKKVGILAHSTVLDAGAPGTTQPIGAAPPEGSSNASTAQEPARSADARTQ